MKLIKFTCECAVVDTAVESAIMSIVGRAIEKVDAVLAHEEKLQAAPAVASSPSNPEKPKRKWTRHVKPADAVKVNANGERETRFVKDDGTVVTTRK